MLVAGSLTVSIVESVIGTAGTDTITVGTAGTGGTFIRGGLGADALTGVAGTADTFNYTAINQSDTGTFDTISGFVTTSDKLQFAGLLTGTFAYQATAAFTGGGNSQARFEDTSTNILQIDTNGDGVTDMKLTLTGITSAGIVAGDFVWS